MALPKLETAKYSTRVPSTGKNITFRPFLVKEEKMLLVAQESKDDRNIFGAMKDLVSACTFNAVDPNALTSYDLEFIFLKIRAKSVGETSTVRIPCSECGELKEVTIDLDTIEVVFPEDRNDTFILTESGVGVKMRHILVRDIEKIAFSGATQTESLTDMIIAHIESVFDTDGVYPVEDTNRAELEEFIGSMSRSQIAQLESYIGRVPKLEKVIKFKCGKCGHVNEVTLSGISAFFESPSHTRHS